MAYSNSFHGPFIYDDKPAIFANPSIASLWPITRPLSPPSAGGTTVGGRPLLNLSLAFNYAIGATNVFSYHVTNLAIHILAALVLFFLILRALRSYQYFGDVGLRESPYDPPIFAGAIALLWVLHPMQTESVTYVVQRAESLAGLFFLLTLYCFVRATTGGSRRLWLSASLVSALLGGAAKETLATAPFIVLLFDRTFVAGTFDGAWKARKRYYLSFLRLWLELGLLVASTGFDRGGSIGFGVSLKWYSYSMTQFEAVTRYVGLAIWPTALVFDYGQIAPPTVAQILPYILIVCTLLGLTVWGLVTKPALGFLGAVFFVILAPTSSVIPGASQMIVEHRMYLSLAAVIALAVTGCYALIGRWTAVPALVAAVALGAGTYARNRDYASEQAIWKAVTIDFPANADAWNNLASTQYNAGLYAEAKESCLRAIDLNPKLVPAYYNLGKTLFTLKDVPGSIKAYQKALELRPDFAEAHNNLGVSYLNTNEREKALVEFRIAVRQQANLPEAMENLAITEEKLGLIDAAERDSKRAVALNPRSVNAHNAMGNVYLREKNFPKARGEYGLALLGDPKNPNINANLGNACLLMNDPKSAIPYYLQTLKSDPSRADVAGNIGNAYLQLGRNDEALVFFQASLAANPNVAETHFDYATALENVGLYADAEAQLKAVQRLNPDMSGLNAKLAEVRRLAGNKR